MQEQLKKYLEILDAAEDYLTGGWPKEREKLHEEQLSLRVSVDGGKGRLSGGVITVRENMRTGDTNSGLNDRFELIPEGSRPEAADATTAAEEESWKSDTLDSIAAEVRDCRKCRLSEGRRNAVPGEGALHPKVMIIGEAPGAQEDATGHPFVGRAGQYLDKWLQAIGLDRDRDIFIGNIIKCRPPDNRDPLPDESSACMPYLKRQIRLIQPKTILTLGRISTHILTGTNEGIGKLHGKVFQFQGVPLVPTYHPSGVLRNPVYRKPVWDDLRVLKRVIEEQEGKG
ncbi:MAG: uracil-DNA glycosylase [Spirochaetota bacterium]|nr:uracil-DNA glycosylase [Spirochaetota bacterium]